NTATIAQLPNSIARAEQHLADLIIDPTTGVPFVNEAVPGTFVEPGVINYEQEALSAGAFNSTNGYPDVQFPRITAAAPAFISPQAVAYLDLTAGFPRFAVRSDDNFQVTAGPVATDTNIILGIFDANGRGDAETTFDFLAEAAGLYAFRLVYEEGQ